MCLVTRSLNQLKIPRFTIHMIIISLHFCKQSLNLRIMPCNCTFTIKSFDIGDENCYLNGHAYFLQSVTLFKPLCQFIRSQFYNIFLLAISIHDTAELTFCEAVLGGILSNYIVEVFKKGDKTCSNYVFGRLTHRNFFRVLISYIIILFFV